jgi:hypothetical protein
MIEEISDPPPPASDKIFRHSKLREQIIEHVFVSDLLRRLWQLDIFDVEVLRSEFDAGGYDVAISLGEIVRFIQLKTLTLGGKRRDFNIALKLARRIGGCVVVIEVDEDLKIHGYRWLGGEPGAALGDLGDKITVHSKGNALGQKTERAALRDAPLSRFSRCADIDELICRLFGGVTASKLTSKISASS